MPARLIPKPFRIEMTTNLPKLIEEFVGGANTGTPGVSIARMTSPGGWEEPGQTPDFDEYTVVLKGTLKVETKTGVHMVNAGQGIITPKGEWVRYSTPGGGCEYIAVCLPAFSPDTVHRDA